MLILLFLLIVWYFIGYLFYIMYLLCRFDNMFRSDFKHAFIWAILGPFWILIVILWSIHESLSSD
jgi:uncharacterized membrane protein YesL